MRRKRLQVTLLIMAFIILLNIIFVKAALFPLYYEKEQLDKKNNLLMTNIDNLEQAEINMDKKYNHLQSQSLKTMIPAEPQVSLLYEYIDTTADCTEVFLREVYFPKQEIGTDQAKPCENSINLAISGTYSNLMVFIEKIEASPRLFTINNISITKQKNVYPSKTEVPDTINNENNIESDSKIILNFPEKQEESDIKDDPDYKAEMEINYYFLPDSGPEKINNGASAK